MSIQRINYNGETIIHADFTGLKEQGMMDQVDQVVEILLAEKIPRLLLYEYSPKNYATPKFMRHLEGATRKVIPFVKKSAIVVIMSLPKKMILKGYNMLFRRNIKAFETREEALQHLTDGTV